MGRIVSILIIAVVVVVAAAYITDMPILRPVREVTDRIIGEIPRPAKSMQNCYECEASCAEQFEKCKETHCKPSEKQEVLNKCVDRCADLYRGCYLHCASQFGQEKCPPRKTY